MRFKLLWVLVAFFLAPCISGAEEITGEGNIAVEVSGLWARPAALGANTAVYGMWVNQGDATVTITKVEAKVASHSTIHNTITENGVSRMVGVDKLALPSKVSVELRPGSMHLMLMHLREELIKGASIELDITYQVEGQEDKSIITYKIPVGQN